MDENVLARHGATVLKPDEAVPAADGSEVSPTVYRRRWLMVPGRLLRDRDFVRFLGRVLKKMGLGYRIPGAIQDLDMRYSIELVPVPATLLERPIDAWYVLQALRIAAGEDFAEAVTRVGLVHLFFASDHGDGFSMSGTPGGMEGHGGDGSGRTPVYLPLYEAPQRQSPLPEGQRRPVVAVLDTGCGQHPWLDKVTPSSPDAFVDDRTPPYPLAPDPEADPDQVWPLRGELDSHSGHGTFIAGIVRQLAPEAQVLSIRLMSSDGVVREDHLELALHDLLVKVTAVQNDVAGAGPFVDVISMSFGGYLESPPPPGTGIGARIQQLWAAGVLVIASAGNDASTDLVYPAAFDGVTSVGALAYGDTVGSLDPGYTAAIYSNAGDWISVYAPGYGIVSTLPSAFQGSHTPRLRHPAAQPQRQSYDRDRFSYGFATWSGTSFAAAVFAGQMARLLSAMQQVTPADPDRQQPELAPMSDFSSTAAMLRAEWAVHWYEGVPWQ